MQTVDFIFSVLGVVGGVGFIALLIRFARQPPHGSDEEAARAYFDRHGRWPDEEPEGRAG